MGCCTKKGDVFQLCDIGVRGGEIKPGDKLYHRDSVGRNPSMNRIDEVREELLHISGELGDDIVFTEVLFADFIGFSLGDRFIQVPERMNILMEQDMERVRLEQPFICLKDAPERCGVDDNDVGSDRVVRPNEAIKGGANLLEPKH